MKQSTAPTANRIFALFAAAYLSRGTEFSHCLKTASRANRIRMSHNSVHETKTCLRRVLAEIASRVIKQFSFWHFVFEFH